MTRLKIPDIAARTGGRHIAGGTTLVDLMREEVASFRFASNTSSASES